MSEKMYGDYDLETRHQIAKEHAVIISAEIKLKLRDEFAAQIMCGICGGDWKFDTSIKSWDEMASARAYQIAAAMIKEREISNV